MPPEFRGEEFELNWEKINSEVSGFPVQYPLTVRGREGEGEEGEAEIDDDLDDAPFLPVICHKVKVQR